MIITKHKLQPKKSSVEHREQQTYTVNAPQNLLSHHYHHHHHRPRDACDATVVFLHYARASPFRDLAGLKQRPRTIARPETLAIDQQQQQQHEQQQQQKHKNML